MSDFYRRWPADPETDYRPGLEEFTSRVQLPDIAKPGVFNATRTEGRTDFFDTEGGYYKRLERLAGLADIGSTGALLAASGLVISRQVSQQMFEGEPLPAHTSITLATDALAVVRDKSHRLAEAGVVTRGPRMRVGLHTTSNLFSMRTLVDAVHNRTVLISSVDSKDPEVQRTNDVEKTHDILDHVAAALIRSDEIVQLEVSESGKRLKGLTPDQSSDDIHTYAGTYDETSTVRNVQALFEGDNSRYADWQYLWGVKATAMSGIVERWHEQLNGLVVPDNL